MITGCQHTVVTTHSFSRFAKFQHPVPSRLACGMGNSITKSKEAKVLPKPCKSLFLIEKIIEIDFFFFQKTFILHATLFLVLMFLRGTLT